MIGTRKNVQMHKICVKREKTYNSKSHWRRTMKVERRKTNKQRLNGYRVIRLNAVTIENTNA